MAEQPSIIYIYATANPDFDSSVQTKINSQINAAKKNGISIEGWFFTAKFCPKKENDNIKWFKVPEISSGYFRSIRQKNATYAVILKHLRKALNANQRVYMRYWGPGLGLYKLSVFCRGKLTFNHVTIETLEINQYKPGKGSLLSNVLSLAEFKWIPLLTDHTWGRLIRINAGKGIVNSEPIAKHQRAMAFGRYRCAIIADGVDAETFTLHAAPPLDDEIRMIFLKGAAFDADYNGLDRLMKGMAAGGCKRRVKLTIIGSGLEYEKGLAAICEALAFTEFKGRMSKAELDVELNSYHMGVGALAVHRKGLSSTSSIKNREYFARGIPFFFAHHDPDLHGNPETLNYCFVSDGNETPIRMSDLEQFLESMYAIPHRAKAMHALALKHMDYQAKVQQIAAFVQQT